MALSVGDFVASIGLDDSAFNDVLGQMQEKFTEAKNNIVKRAEEAGQKVAEALGKSQGPVVGAAAGLGVQAATAIGGGLLGLLGGQLQGLLASKLQAGLEVAIGFLTGVLQPAFDAVGNFITGTLVPAFQALGQWISNNQTPLMIVGGIILTFFLPALLQLGIAAAVAAASTVAAFISMAAQAVVAGATFLAQSAVMLFQWGLMGFAAMANAVKMAAAWLIAMGPIPLIIAAVVGLVALIIANWDTIVAWTTATFQAIWDFLKMVWNGIVTAIQAAVDFVLSIVTAVWQGIVAVTTTVFNGIWSFLQGIWNTIVGLVQGAINGVMAAISWLGQLPGMVGGWFASVLNAAVGKLGELVSWIGGLPGRILGAIGDLGNLLYDVGSSILEGLWNGLKSAANWVKDKIIGLIKDIIPGPIKSILGISSPSKVAAELGRWVPLGLAQGIEDTSVAVSRASAQLAGLVTRGIGNVSAVAVPPGLATPGPATGAISGERAVVWIENFYATPSQRPADIAAELDWMSRGGG